jgi:Flp pilus assembly pilin Flp
MMKNERKQEKGQSLVEFAVIATLLIVMLVGVVDIGRIFLTYMTMRDAAQEGAVYGAINPAYCHQVEERVLSMVSNPADVQVEVLIDGGDCFSANPDTQACIGNEIMVNVVDPAFPMVMPLVSTFLGKNEIRLQASVAGTILRPGCSTP